MANTTDQATEYLPDVIIPPGEHIQEMLDEKGWTQKELARRMGRPLQTINEIINGKRSITAETAVQLEESLGLNAQTWLNLESSYRLALVRRDRPAKNIHEIVLATFARHFHVNDTRDLIEALLPVTSELARYGSPQELLTETGKWLSREPAEADKVIRRLRIDSMTIELFRRVTDGLALFAK